MLGLTKKAIYFIYTCTFSEKGGGQPYPKLDPKKLPIFETLIRGHSGGGQSFSPPPDAT